MPKALATIETMSSSIHRQAVIKLGRYFKCSPEKAVERMGRPAAKYDLYRVAMANLVDSMITEAMERIDANQTLFSLAPGHWSAAPNADKHVNAALGKVFGLTVCYWTPKAGVSA